MQAGKCAFSSVPVDTNVHHDAARRNRTHLKRIRGANAVHSFIAGCITVITHLFAVSKEVANMVIVQIVRAAPDVITLILRILVML
ncbi:hypothetical protein TNCV_2971941 [Trichonephila clavipes]|nr:hypothetical protein TNCV_2971941 [Trichonephila clavipes]